MLVRLTVLGMLFSALLQAADVPEPIAGAVAAKRVTAEFSGNGRETASLKLSNPGAAPIKVTIPVGTVLVGENGERQVTLRALTTELGVGAEADAILPTAALSSKNTSTQRPLKMTTAGEPRIAKLLPYFEKQNDLPRPTAQLSVFIVLEDMGWPAWKQWLEAAWAAEKPPKQHPTPAEIAQAVDAIAFARLAEPEKKAAFLTDEEFKRFALRNPWARGKAMALYGLSVDDAISGEPSLPPDLGKLLHSAPNDNCPICRQRDKMQKGDQF